MIAVAVCGPASAAVTTFYWDRNGSTAGSGNTGGVWDTSSMNWNDNSGGVGNTKKFSNGDIAIFSAGTDGTGSITITGNATAGGLTIQEGTVEFTGNITLGANAIAVDSGATLVTNSSARLSTSTGSVITLNGGTLRSTNPSAGSFVDSDSTITLNGGGIIDYTVANTLSTIQSTTVISGSGGITKNGVGVIALASASTYTGGTTINGGELRISGADDRLPTTGNVAVNASGILNLNDRSQTIGTLSGSGQIGLGNGTLTASSSSSSTFSGAIKDTANAGASGSTNTGGKLAKSGTGTLTLSGANTYTGGTAINGGTLALGSSGAIGTTGTISFGGGTLQFSSSNTTDYSARFSNAANQAYKLDTSGQSVALASALASSGGTLTKLGTGTLSLTAANTYTGGTTVNAGTLEVTNTSGSGTGSGNITVSSGNLNVGNGGTGGAVSGDISNNGTVNFNRSDDSSYSGQISGTGVVNKRGAGNLTLSGNSSHNGGTTQFDGGLKLGHKNALGAGTYTIGDATTTTTLKVSSTTNLTGANAVGNAVTIVKDFTVASGSSDLELSGGVSLGAVNRTVTIDSSNPTVLSGVIADTGGTGGVTKAGAGVLTLTGANTYGGGTTVSAGTLLANNTSGSATGTGSVTVDAGATLGGTGSVSGAVTVNGKLSPGASIETLDTGDLTFGAGSQFVYELNSNLALAVAADLVNAAGNLTINPATLLSVTDFGSTKLPYGTKFTLISYSGSWVQPPVFAWPNHFAGLPNGSSFTVGLNQWNIRYDDPNGGSNFSGGSFAHHVTITAVPEASAFLTVGLSGIFAIAAVWMTKRLGINVLKP